MFVCSALKCALFFIQCRLFAWKAFKRTFFNLIDPWLISKYFWNAMALKKLNWNSIVMVKNRSNMNIIFFMLLALDCIYISASNILQRVVLPPGRSIVSIIYRVLLYSLVSYLHVYSKLLTDYFCNNLPQEDFTLTLPLCTKIAITLSLIKSLWL